MTEDADGACLAGLLSIGWCLSGSWGIARHRWVQTSAADIAACGRRSGWGGGGAAITISQGHVAVPLPEADRVAAGQVVAVLGQRVDREGQVGQRPVEEVRGQEVRDVGAEAADTHVQAARAGVQPLGGVAEGVDWVGLVGVFALAEGAVALTVGRVEVIIEG